MILVPEHVEHVWEVTSAGAHLPENLDVGGFRDRLLAIVQSSFKRSRSGYSYSIYPGSYPENLTGYVLEHLLPRDYAPLKVFLSELQDSLAAEGRDPVNALLALLVVAADYQGDTAGVKRAHELLGQDGDPYRERLIRRNVQPRRAGQAPKRLKGVFAYTLQLVKQNPKISATEAWRSFPESEDAFEIEGFEVYRDGEQLFQVNASGNTRSLKFNGFRRYLTEARKKLRTN